jgi:hypothetical protein
LIYSKEFLVERLQAWQTVCGQQLAREMNRREKAHQFNRVQAGEMSLRVQLPALLPTSVRRTLQDRLSIPMQNTLQDTVYIDTKLFQYEAAIHEIVWMVHHQILAAADEPYPQGLAMLLHCHRDRNCSEGTHQMLVVAELKIGWTLYLREEEAVLILDREDQEEATPLRMPDLILPEYVRE